MKKKNIGIFLDAEKTSGGAYHEFLSYMKNFEKFNKQYSLNFIIICVSKELGFEEHLTQFKTVYFKMNLFKRYIHYLFNFHHFFRRIRKFLFFKSTRRFFGIMFF